MRILVVFLLAMMTRPVLAEVAASIQVDKQFARPAIQRQANSAIYMELRNGGSNAALVSATSEASHVVELHTHINDNGLMRMRKIDRIELPAGQDVRLQPGGLHIMLIGLKRDLVLGEQVDFTLKFDDGSEQTVTAPIQRNMR
jgi:copper(I)-binding protein